MQRLTSRAAWRMMATSLSAQREPGPHRRAANWDRARHRPSSSRDRPQEYREAARSNPLNWETYGWVNYARSYLAAAGRSAAPQRGAALATSQQSDYHPAMRPIVRSLLASAVALAAVAGLMIACIWAGVAEAQRRIKRSIGNGQVPRI